VYTPALLLTFGGLFCFRLHSQFLVSSRQQRHLLAYTFLFFGVYCLDLSVAVFPELLKFIQCNLIEINVPQAWINVKYKHNVGGRPVGNSKHVFNLYVISAFHRRINDICAVLGLT
jgi:hypothetical protein